MAGAPHGPASCVPVAYTTTHVGRETLQWTADVVARDYGCPVIYGCA